MNDCESKADGEGHQAAADVHVVLVCDGKDDDQQQEGAKDLVCCQGVEGNLINILFSCFTFTFLKRISFVIYLLSRVGRVGGKNARCCLYRVVVSRRSSSNCVRIVSPQHEARHKCPQVLSGPIYLEMSKYII